MSTPTYHLYADDSGARQPDLVAPSRKDGMDHFAMGGFIIAAECAGDLAGRLEALKVKHGVTAPFHSSKMRSRKGAWSWLGLKSEEDRAASLYMDLEGLLCLMPASALACVVHRPGYISRYSFYAEQRWQLCKSAYAILVERAAKIAERDGRRLSVYVEATGPKEDQQIREYHKQLRQLGSIFNPVSAAKYEPLEQSGFQRTMLQSPNFFNKTHSLGQIADLVLYPLVKGKYEPSYRPYVALKESGKLADDSISMGNSNLGIKYYCFDH